MQRVNAATFQHLCIFYTEPEELWSGTASLLETAARDGYRWLYFADEHDVQRVRSELAAHLPEPLPPGEVMDTGELHPAEAPLFTAPIIADLRARAQTAREQGFAGLQLLTEMTWLLRTDGCPLFNPFQPFQEWRLR